MIISFLFCFFFCFLGPHLWHMDVPRLGLESVLRLPVYTIATKRQIQATSVTYTTVHGSARSLTHWVRAKDWTCILMDASRVQNPLSHNRNFPFFSPLILLVSSGWASIWNLLVAGKVWWEEFRPARKKNPPISGLRIQRCCELWGRLQMQLGSGIAVAVV